MCCGVGVVPGCEVPVEGRDDCVLLPLLHVAPERKKTFVSVTERQANEATVGGGRTCPTVRCRARRRWPGPHPQRR